MLTAEVRILALTHMKPQKVFLIRKIVKATSVSDALKQEKDTPVLDVYTPNQSFDFEVDSAIESIGKEAKIGYFNRNNG